MAGETAKLTTGGALQVTSSGMVSNLNAQYLGGIPLSDFIRKSVTSSVTSAITITSPGSLIISSNTVLKLGPFSLIGNTNGISVTME